MTPLHWWDWLTLHPSELRELGLDPKERYTRIGHKRPLSKRWARTVGYWAITPARELIARAGMNYKDTGARSRYDQFKHRWELKTSLQAPKGILDSIHGNPRTILAEEAYSTVYAALVGGRAYAKRYPFHKALKLAANAYGILPIEAFIYYRGFLEVCEFHGFETLEQYTAIEDRTQLWEEANVMPWLPPRIATAYAMEEKDEAEVTTAASPA